MWTAISAPSSAATPGAASQRRSPSSERPPRRSRCTSGCSARAVFQALERREMTYGGALIAALLEESREIEVRLGDRRVAGERRVILAHRFVDRSLVLEHDAEVEMRDAVLRRELDRFAIQRFGLVERLRGVAHSAEVDTRVDMGRIDAKRVAICGFRVERGADALEGDAELEPIVRGLREPGGKRGGAALGE